MERTEADGDSKEGHRIHALLMHAHLNLVSFKSTLAACFHHKGRTAKDADAYSGRKRHRGLVTRLLIAKEKKWGFRENTAGDFSRSPCWLLEK